MKGAKSSETAAKATTSTWVIVDEVSDPVKPLSPGAYEIAKLLEGEERANELLEITRQDFSDGGSPRRVRATR